MIDSDGLPIFIIYLFQKIETNTFSMNKTFILTAAMLLSGIVEAFSQTVTLPYVQEFETSLGDMTAVNKEDGSPTFAFSSYGGYNYGGGVIYSGSADYAADDVLLSPEFEVEAGKVYDVSVMCKNNAYGHAFTVELRAGASADDLTETVLAPAAVEYGYSFSTLKGRLAASADGKCRIGLLLTGDAGTGSVYFDNFTVAAGVAAKSPGAVTEIAAETAVAGDNFIVSLSCKAPETDFSGAALDGAVSMKAVRSDGKEVWSAGDVAPGEVVSFIDEEPLTSKTAYTVTAANPYGSSLPTEISFAPSFAVPSAVANLSVTEDAGNITLSWDAVTGSASEKGIFIPSKVVYAVQRNVGTAKTVIAEGLKDTRLADVCALPETGQDAVSYTVTPSFYNVSGQSAVSETLLVGDAYRGEYSESFRDYTFETRSWTVDGVSSVWEVASSSVYSPQCDPQDADNGLLKCRNNGTQNSRMSSPLINVADMKNPRLEFYVYQDSSLNYTNAVVPMLRSGGDDVGLGEAIAVNGGEKGWHKFSYYIPEGVRDADFQIVFDALPGGYASVCIDNISVKDILDSNLSLSELSLPAKAEPGDKVAVKATVTNKGSLAAEDYTLEYSVGGKLSGSVGGAAVGADESVELTFSIDITPDMADKAVAVDAALIFDGDEDETDNALSATLKVGTNSFPVPQNLKAEVKGSSVMLSWTRPELSAETEHTDVLESFEEWASGSTEPEQGWLFIDVDKAEANGFGGVNSGVAMAAMVVENVEYCTPRTGTKVLGVSRPYSYRDTPDKWLVSPEVIGGQTVRFYAASFSDYGYPYYDAKFSVCWSAGGTEPEDFTQIGDENSLKTSSWTEFTAELPANATRFAVHVTAVGDDGLLFDDFSFVKGVSPLELKGYNIYRNGVKAASTDAGTTSCEDADTEPGETYSYTVSAVYDRGESLLAGPVTAGPTSGIAVAVAGRLRVRTAPGMLHLSSATATDAVVTDLSGRTVCRKTVSGATAIALPSGVYIVKTAAEAVKVAVR